MAGPYYDPGRYVARIIEHGIGKAKTGTPFVFLKCRILGYDGSEDSFGESQQQERIVYLYLNDKTHERVRAGLEAAGWNGSDWQDLQANPQLLFGVDVVVRCEHDEYQGNRREKWGLAGGSFTPEALDDKSLRGLNAMFGKANGSKPKTAAKPATKPKTIDEANRELQDSGAKDTIPF